MTTSPPRGAVVVGTDDSAGGGNALDTAVSEALLTHRPLHIVHTWAAYPAGYAPGAYPTTAAELADSIREYAASVLAAAVSRVRDAHPTLEVSEELAEGDTRQILEDLSHDASVLVVGSRGHGAVRRLLLGSTSAWLARHAHCPLLVVRPSLEGNKPGVAVGTDGGHASTQAVAYAFEAASRRDVPLQVVHCYDPIPLHTNEGYPGLPPGEPEAEGRTLAVAVAGLGEKYPDVEVTLESVPRSAVDHLVELSDHVELVVVGSHRRSKAGHPDPPLHQPGRGGARPLHRGGGRRPGLSRDDRGRPPSSGP